MAARLEELDKDLTDISTHVFPESHVKKTLQAHGFLSRQKDEHHVLDNKVMKGTIISDEEKKKTTQLIYHFREGKEFHSLREPISLVRYQRPTKSQPFWPVEVDSVSYHCSFLWDVPANPELLCTLEKPIISPKTRSSLGEGTVVYCNLPGPEKFFTKARLGPNISVSCHNASRTDDTGLTFDSRFESGNLAKAIRVGRWDYELYLRYDLYTHKHTQWFYFSVQNMKRDQTYRFTIVNFYKSSSLYNEGMQPLHYSEKMAFHYNIGWRRAGFSIKYFKTNLRRVDTTSEQYYYGLTWSHTFQMENDICYFCHCYPYTFSDLQDYLCRISTDPFKSTICKHRTLCYTIAGNPVPILTITSPSQSPGDSQKKKAVVVTARVHPGETNSSWMMKGLIDQLTSQSPDAKILRDTFVFKVIPMLNPDGVIVGNYRCSLSGRDLNRNYHTKLRDAYPTVWHTKQYIKKLSEERDIVVYCDLHGHSRKHNVFIYGCDDVQNPLIRLRSRVFPIMLSRNAPTKFSYDICNFKVQKAKEGTGRVFMWKELGILNSYTMEATFCGNSLGKGNKSHFSIKDFEDMGSHFCDTLLDYCDPDQTKVNIILNQLLNDYRNRLVSKLMALQVPIPPGVDPLDVDFGYDVYSGLESRACTPHTVKKFISDTTMYLHSDSGSDSSDSDGPPVHLIRKKQRKHKKFRSCKERSKQKVQIKLTHKLNEHSPKHETCNTTELTSNLKAACVSTLTSKPVIDKTEGKMKDKGLTICHDLADFNKAQNLKSQTPSDFVKQRNKSKFNEDLVMVVASRLSTHSKDDIPAPIAIMPKILQQPSQSKTKLNPFPQTSESASTTSFVLPQREGAFAHNYVIHHLQDEAQMDTSWCHDYTTSSNTKNLVSLSKVFRHLKPHLLGSSNFQTGMMTNPSTVKSFTALEENISIKECKHKQGAAPSLERSFQYSVPNSERNSDSARTKSFLLVPDHSSLSLKPQSATSSHVCKTASSTSLPQETSSHAIQLYSGETINDQSNSSSNIKNELFENACGLEDVYQLTKSDWTDSKLSASQSQAHSHGTMQELLINMTITETRDYEAFHNTNTDTCTQYNTNHLKVGFSLCKEGSSCPPLETQVMMNSTPHAMGQFNGIITPSLLKDTHYKVHSNSHHTQNMNVHFKKQMEHKKSIANAVKQLPRSSHSYSKPDSKRNSSSCVVLPELFFPSGKKRVHSSRGVYTSKTKLPFNDYRPKTTPYAMNSFHEQPNKIIPSTVSLMLSNNATLTQQIHHPRPLQLRYYCNKKY